MINNVGRQEIKERSVFHVLRDQPELNPSAGVLVVGRDEPENVFVPQHDRLKYLDFSKPRLFVDRRKNFHRNVLASPFALILKKIELKWNLHGSGKIPNAS
jgi:hypothetical protein